jgi:large subunit ribosomal protein LP0
MVLSDTKKKKQAYMNQFLGLTQEYSKILIVQANNVGSNQLAKIRIALRGKAVLLMGKNTLMKKAIKDNQEKNKKLVPLCPFIKGNVGLVFTNGDVKEIRTLIEDMKVPAAAKQGSISPITVIIPAGSTGMEPTKTSFFQALDIPTKITRGAVDIISDFALLRPGDRVGSSEATLLQMMDIKPFSYGLVVKTVYDDGSVYAASVLDLTDDDMLAKFMRGACNVAAIGLETGIPNEASIPHSIVNSFKNLLSIACGTDYTFKQAQSVKEYLSDPTKFATVVETKEEVKEDKKPDADDDDDDDSDKGSSSGSDIGLGGLF